MDETERQHWASQVEAVRERADVSTRALFTMRHRLDEAAKEWARTANGFPVAQSLRILADDCNKAWHAAIAAHDADGAGADASSPVSASAPLRPRAETTYLTIIGALLELVRNPRPGRDSDAAVIRELIDNYADKPGISKTTLETKFAEARRRLNAT